MAEINVTALAMVHAPPDEVRAAIADYREVRPTILTRQFSGYEVLDGGRGTGSRVRWTLKPSRWGKRDMRDWEILAEESGDGLVERDTRSDVEITWTVLPGPDERSVVKVTLTWPGADGFAGIRERTRAGTLRRVYGELLHMLRERLGRAATRPASPAEPRSPAEPVSTAEPMSPAEPTSTAEPTPTAEPTAEPTPTAEAAPPAGEAERK